MSNTSFPLPPKVPTALVPTPIVDGRDPQIERLRVVIREQLMNEQIVDLARIARQLGKSTRTMQRHIAARGTSFRDIVQDVRREIAMELLAQGELTVARVSDAVGYSDPKALRRAFHRWGAGAPSQHRRKSSAPPPPTTEPPPPASEVS